MTMTARSDGLLAQRRIAPSISAPSSNRAIGVNVVASAHVFEHARACVQREA
jgi:hypothetical protein